MAMEDEQNERVFRYAGVPVRFPYVPYRSQNALMHGTITAANRGAHALLEAPTGTGKSLALLCSALAWQEQIAERISQKRIERQEKANECHVLSPPKTSPAKAETGHVKEEKKDDDNDERAAPAKREKSRDLKKEEETPKAEVKQEQAIGTETKDIKTPRRKRAKVRKRKKATSKPKEEEGSGSDADFQTPIQFRDTEWQKHAKLRSGRVRKDPEDTFSNAHLIARFESWERDAPLDAESENESAESDGGDGSGDDEDRLPRKVPRIFYATRTHNQVSQIVEELRKTSYRPRMTVLASRREYCVRPEVQQLKNRNDVCKGLVKARSCMYYHNVQQLAEDPALDGEVWDIEELFNRGKGHNGCPYYASTELYKQASVIFCPYSYIVDKTVRDAAGINIKGDIVVFDEAHNIETYARDSASFTVNVADLRQVIDDFAELIQEGKLGSPNSDLALAGKDIIEAFANLLKLIDAVLAEPLEQDYDLEFALHEGEVLHDLFLDHGITERCIEECQKGITLIRETHDEDAEKNTQRTNGNRGDENIYDGEEEGQANHVGNGNAGYGGPDPTAQTMNTQGPTQRKRRRRARQLSLLADEDAEDGEVPKSVSRCLFVAHQLATTMVYYFSNPDDYSLVLQRRVRDFQLDVTLNLWCLNAAVSFQPISTMARSVIVTSGTLSPLRSFAGELGTEFQVTKSLPHVINVRKQLHVGVVARGPGAVLFDATFTGSSTFAFQDSLGEAIESYCKLVPSGVLVFLPSYRLLDKLRARWEGTGLFERLCETKGGVFFEPNRRGEDFDKMMADYAVRASSPDGAVLFGVCRGKLAEGIDFRDETARAVIIIGIPFPSKGDLQVVRKQAWNNRQRASSKRTPHMSGSEWYETQGYRALNQALGRVIRHKLDYGSILLLDHRYKNPDVLNKLPGWTREVLPVGRGSHEEVRNSLRCFFENAHRNVAQVAGVLQADD